jgi:hypothetical protein
VTPLVKLLLDAHAAGLFLRIDENFCLCARPAGRLTLDMRRRLSFHKPALIALLLAPAVAAETLWRDCIADVGQHWDALFPKTNGVWFDDSALREEATLAIRAGEFMRALDAAARWRHAWLGALEAGSPLPQKRRRNLTEER